MESILTVKYLNNVDRVKQRRVGLYAESGLDRVGLHADSGLDGVGLMLTLGWMESESTLTQGWMESDSTLTQSWMESDSTLTEGWMGPRCGNGGRTMTGIKLCTASSAKFLQKKLFKNNICQTILDCLP